MSQTVIVVDVNDNVATALRTLEEGESVSAGIGGKMTDVTVLTRIPFGHKIALKEIEVGQPVIKYGEVIGLATQKMAMGQHVHIHNVEGPEARGDGE
jgi:altronate dehydratase small subunit